VGDTKLHSREAHTYTLAACLEHVLIVLGLLLDYFRSSWEEVMTMNIKKLEARFPDGVFNVDHANNRDVAAEQAAMAK
jgi:hypothetical protein